jgi:hypothetical protein
MCQIDRLIEIARTAEEVGFSSARNGRPRRLDRTAGLDFLQD